MEQDCWCCHYTAYLLQVSKVWVNIYGSVKSIVVSSLSVRGTLSYSTLKAYHCCPFSTTKLVYDSELDKCIYQQLPHSGRDDICSYFYILFLYSFGLYQFCWELFSVCQDIFIESCHCESLSLHTMTSLHSCDNFVVTKMSIGTTF